MTDTVALMVIVCGMLFLADTSQVVVNVLLLGAVGLLCGLSRWETLVRA